jgi:hypothetical protein
VTADRRKGSDHQQKGGHNNHRHKGRDRGRQPRDGHQQEGDDRPGGAVGDG